MLLVVMLCLAHKVQDRLPISGLLVIGAFTKAHLFLYLAELSQFLLLHLLDFIMQRRKLRCRRSKRRLDDLSDGSSKQFLANMSLDGWTTSRPQEPSTQLAGDFFVHHTIQ